MNKTGKTEKLEYKERLVIRSPGAYGYLRFPKAFLERYNHDKKALPEPEAFLVEERGKVRLIFEWIKTDLESSKRSD